MSSTHACATNRRGGLPLKALALAATLLALGLPACGKNGASPNTSGTTGSGGSGGTSEGGLAGNGGSAAGGSAGAGADAGTEGSSGSPSVDCPLPPAESGDPALPAKTVDTAPPTTTGKVISVRAGGDLQAAINQASPGDVIELEAGAVFSGNFTLPDKAGSSYIVIRSSKMADLPPYGERVSPADAGNMAVLETEQALPVVKTANGAHHYRLEGLELRPAPGVDVNDMVVFGSETATDPSQQAHHLIVDRCYIHGDATAGGKRGIRLNSAYSAIVDSYVSDFKRAGQDTQAIAGWNGPGPFEIVNNTLEGAAENILFGGADSKSAAMNPADIRICKNHIIKPLQWKTQTWTIKNLLELKNASRVLISANVLENNWAQAQTGFGIVMKSVNQDNTAPWSVTEDVTFVDNLVKNSENGANISARGDGNPTTATSKRFRFSDNLFEPSSSILLQLLNDLDAFKFTHNTGFATHTAVSLDSGVGPGAAFVMQDNIIGMGQYGVKGSSHASGTDSLNAFFSSWTFDHNVLIGATQSAYPAGNFFPATNADVGFVDFAGGKFALSAASPYAGKASDGTDVGADIQLVNAATQGVASP